MRLKKAIKYLSNYIGTGPEPEPVELDKSIALGIQALKRVQASRKFHLPAAEVLLLGETVEKEEGGSHEH